MFSANASFSAADIEMMRRAIDLCSSFGDINANLHITDRAIYIQPMCSDKGGDPLHYHTQIANAFPDATINVKVSDTDKRYIFASIRIPWTTRDSELLQNKLDADLASQLALTSEVPADAQST